MVDQIPEHIKQLASKRRLYRRRDGSFVAYAALTDEEEKALFEFAEQRGFMPRYEFSGIRPYGVSRNHAIDRLLEATRQRAFELMRRAFGAGARFRKRWSNPWSPDFYWKESRLALVITGPAWDDPYRGDPRRTRDLRQVLDEEVKKSSKMISKLLKVPYYVIWHQPTRFLDQVRQELVASGKYPRLTQK